MSAPVTSDPFAEDPTREELASYRRIAPTLRPEDQARLIPWFNECEARLNAKEPSTETNHA